MVFTERKGTGHSFILQEISKSHLRTHLFCSKHLEKQVENSSVLSADKMPLVSFLINTPSPNICMIRCNCMNSNAGGLAYHVIHKVSKQQQKSSGLAELFETKWVL